MLSGLKGDTPIFLGGAARFPADSNWAGAYNALEVVLPFISNFLSFTNLVSTSSEGQRAGWEVSAEPKLLSLTPVKCGVV
jgi:hypothetical protein